MGWLWQICTILALTSCVYSLGAAFAARRFASRVPKTGHSTRGVTILKPLYGLEPRIFENLASFCRQNYAGPVQIVFGVQRADDPVIGVAERLIREMPDRDIALVVDERLHGANRKVSNLINMEPRIRHDVIVLADSDMAVEADYLDRVVAALEGEGIGLVTCLYRGEPVAGLWSKLAVQAIDYHFLPNVLVGIATGLARPCFGSTIALSRDTLGRIGGFQRVRDDLADDYALGEAVRQLGLKTAIPPFVVAHCCSDGDWTSLFRHELRWARTIALVDPAGFAGSAITHTLPLALLAWIFSGLSGEGGVIVATALACRLILQINIASTFALPSPRYWLGPLRDMLSFGVFVSCFFARAVDWRGQRYVVQADGKMTTSGK